MPAAWSRFLPRRADYDLSAFRADLLAGITVAVVALPLALGFGVTSGAGAAAGLYTAIVAGIVVAAVGDKLLLAHPEDPSRFEEALVLLGGPALFLLGNYLFKNATHRRWPLSHVIGLGMLALPLFSLRAFSTFSLALWAVVALIAVAGLERWFLRSRAAARAARGTRHGFDAWQRLRGLRDQGVHLPVIVTQTLSHSADRTVAFELGADAVLDKPFEPRELRARVASLLRRSRDRPRGALAAARARGLSPGRAAAEVTAALGRPRSEVYAVALDDDPPEGPDPAGPT